ncbi:MAG: hypothetical protein D6775_00725, partial [Caldilineae bacterium]
MLLLVALIVPQTMFADGNEWEIKGTVQSMPGNGLVGTWVIDGQTIQTNAATRFKQEHGALRVGAFVEAKGYYNGGTRIATKIETKGNDNGDGYRQEWKLYGYVDSMPAGMIGQWVINGQAVQADAYTRFEQQHGPLQVGAYVKAEGYYNGSTRIATKIETDYDAGHPEPTHTPEPGHPEPTETPEPGHPEPTHTPEPGHPEP